jgi:hypothetical protein
MCVNERRVMSELSVLIFRQVLKTVHSLSQRHKGKDLRLRFKSFKNPTGAVQRTDCLNQGGVRPRWSTGGSRKCKLEKQDCKSVQRWAQGIVHDMLSSLAPKLLTGKGNVVNVRKEKWCPVTGNKNCSFREDRSVHTLTPCISVYCWAIFRPVHVFRNQNCIMCRVT